MMSDNAARGPVFTLDSKLKLSRPAAVKTGTTNDWRDAWAAGFTPYVTVGVWTGNNNNEPTAKVESVTSGGVIWHNIMEAVFADPRFQPLLAAPYSGSLPATFTLPNDVVRTPLCKLPGPFNYYADEVFSPDMLKTPVVTSTLGLTLTQALTPSPRLNATATTTATNQLRCDTYASIRVANLGSTTVSVTNDQGETTQQQQKNVCRVVDGVYVPPELITTVSVWKLPAPDPDEKATYTWQGGGATSAGAYPPCTNDVVASVAPPGSIRLPDLRGFGENQAKEQLAALGFNLNTVFIQYQDRTQLNGDYDKYPPYAVVSSVPRAGTYVTPGENIFLGVRAPDAAPAAPTTAPADAAPPVVPQPTPVTAPLPGPPVPTAPPPG